MASLTVDRITSVENLNHPDDYYFYFNNGYFVWNVQDDTLYIKEEGDDFIEQTVIRTAQDACDFAHTVRERV